MALHAALVGHGAFVYNATSTMNRYSPSRDPQGTVDAFRAMGIRTAWIRLFGVSGPAHEPSTRVLIEALRGAKVKLAGWGYCHGADWRSDLDLSVRLSDHYGLEAFVADIEPGNTTPAGKTLWTVADFRTYLKGLESHFGADRLGVSTWPVPKIQDAYDSVKLMKLAVDYVGMFAPQAYWMKFPKSVHYNATGFKQADYPPDSPAAFVNLVIDAWRAMGIATPLTITGQAYWGENGPSQAVMEQKLARFTADFTRWRDLAGFNWWHAGGKGAAAMSNAMVATLTAAKLDLKPYRRR